MAIYSNKTLIGKGGFGEVWQCVRDQDAQHFAKKTLTLPATDDAVRRFAKEVRIQSSLDHPNIVKVIAKRLSAEPYFYIMPLYKRSMFNELPTLFGDEPRIVSIFGRILDGIEYAHAQGVIHRDLKPQNILMNNDTDLVISDFGLGRNVDAESTRQTQTGFGLGTYLYMAPEQVDNAKYADFRCDIYSLGRMLYELYTGPLTLAPQDTSLLPPAIAVLVHRCTQGNPDKRFQSVTDLKFAWRSIFDRSMIASEMDELDGLIIELSSATTFDTGKVKKFTDYLVKHLDDSDLVHKAIMQINPDVFLYTEDIENLSLIINRFVEVTAEEGWGFDYTDNIGNKCYKIFNLIKNYKIRSALIECVMKVGLNHNRWHVLGLAGKMLMASEEPEETIILMDVLNKISETNRNRIVPYLTKSELDPLLRKFFTFEVD